MFINNTRVLFTDIHRPHATKALTLYSSSFVQLSSRKTKDGHLLMKDGQGNNIVAIKDRGFGDENLLLLIHKQNIDGDITFFQRRIADQKISDRIITYLESYYGKYVTNCSALAEYLSTGNFKECDRSKESLMFSGGLTTYTDQKIKPGDVVCVLYYKKRARSRKAPEKMRSHYRKCTKVASGVLQNQKDVKSRLYTPEEFFNLYRDLYRGGVCADYHFLFCVGIKNGQPVFIQQLGYHDPSSDRSQNVAPVIISVGMINMSHYDVPAFVFIKKGRD